MTSCLVNTTIHWFLDNLTYIQTDRDRKRDRKTYGRGGGGGGGVEEAGGLLYIPMHVPLVT